jgi:anti-anti-sigma factor
VRELTFDLDRDGDVVVARLDGEIDSSNSSELRVALAARLPTAARVLALDLSGVTYLDSSGIELLFELGRSLAARRQMIRLIVPETAPIRRVLELCAMESVAPIDRDRADVLGAVARPTD